jgi:hypothetical protein
MIDWLQNSNYLVMSIQVVVTLLLVPIISFKRFNNTATSLGTEAYPSAEQDVKRCVKTASIYYWPLVGCAFVALAAMVGYAIYHSQELLNWDDQSGLMLMYLLAMIPVIVLTLFYKRLFTILKAHAGGKRTARLQPTSVMAYVSLPLFGMIVLANVIFIASVIHFSAQPFDGFAGYVNLLGLVFLDVVFAVIIFTVYRDNHSLSYLSPSMRDAFKRRAILINMVILLLALLHISLSLWVAGSELREFKIISQSIYLQVVLIITAIVLALPSQMFKKTAG